MLILLIFKLYCNLLKLEGGIEILHHVFYDFSFVLLSFLSFYSNPSFIISIESHDLLPLFAGAPSLGGNWAARL